MKKFLRKPVMVIGASVLFIGAAAVSYASLKERSNTKSQEVISVAPAETVPAEAESIEPIGTKDVQTSSAKSFDRGMSYEQQAAMMRDKQARRNEQQQLISTE